MPTAIQKITWIMILTGLMVLGAACSTFGGSDVEPAAPLQPTETPAPEESEIPVVDLPVSGTDWDLVTIDGQPSENQITIRFEEGQVSGSDGCNRYGGGYEISGETLTFISEGFMSTEMACEPEIMARGAAYLGTLLTATSIRLDDDQLIIGTEKGELVFQKPQTAVLENENSRWVLDGTVVGGDAFVHMAIDSEIFIKFEDGQVSGYGGCNNFSGSYEVDGNQLTFGPLAATLMMCEGERSEREAAVFGYLDQVGQYAIERQTLSLSDADGLLLMTFRLQSE